MIDKYPLNAYLYFDKRKKLEVEERLLEKIMEAEEKVERRDFQRSDQVKKYLSQNAAEVKAFFEIKKSKGVYVLKRDRAEIEKTISRMGYVIILSSRRMRHEEIMTLYRNKDCVEKCFDNMKNELSTNRLRVHSRESMEGRLFVSFLNLILYSWIYRTMREKDLHKKYTLEEVMYEIKKFRLPDLGALSVGDLLKVFV